MKYKPKNPVAAATTNKYCQNVSIASDADECHPSPSTYDAVMNITDQLINNIYY